MTSAEADRSPVPRARLLLTGDELLRGFVQDANSVYLAERLRDAGVELDEIRIVGDDVATIQEGVSRALAGNDVRLVIVCGGLGPTHDDRTSEAVAAVCGRALELDAAALEVVEARVRAYGRMRTPEEVATFTPGNRKQATLPAGARWVEPLGTAPGYVVRTDDGGAVVAVLPGPPSELRHAWQGIEATDEYADVLASVGARHERLIRVWGVPESRASHALAATGHTDGRDTRVTICARDGELEIAVRGSDPSAVDALVEQLASGIGVEPFAVDDHRSISALVAAGLQERGWTLATAESCTGGMLGGLLTSEPGSSAWYLGGLITYANETKVHLANVAPATLESDGAVSEATARQLARGAAAALGADVGIGITGVAGPGGGSAEKPVGTVHIAVVSPGGELHRKVRIPGDRATVRRRSCVIALHELRLSLTASAR